MTGLRSLRRPSRSPTMRRIVQLFLAVVVAIAPAFANEPLAIKPLAERKVDALPGGTLYWRIENFPDAAAAANAAGPWSLVAEAAGKVWLFTLTADPKASGSGARVADVGPIPRVDAPSYLLRINQATGAPGSQTPVYTHPGSEAL